MDFYSVLFAKELAKANQKSLIVKFGTWTPEFYQVQASQPLPTFNYANHIGYYYRIGRICFVTLYLGANITGTSNAYLSVSGFPYSSIDDKYNTWSFLSGTRTSDGETHVSVARIADKAQYFLFPDQSGGSVSSYAKFPTGQITLNYSGWYIIASTYGEYEET